MYVPYENMMRIHGLKSYIVFQSFPCSVFVVGPQSLSIIFIQHGLATAIAKTLSPVNLGGPPNIV